MIFQGVEINKFGLYVHIPFCKSKCKYCDFVSWAGKEEQIPDYLQLLEKEIKLYPGKEISTLYIGGGTPSILSEKQLEQLFNCVCSNFNTAGLTEITVEANPGTLTAEKLAVLKSLGVNRLSLGIQTFSDKLLKLLGRIYTSEEAIKTYNLCRKTGFDNISLDLMFAIPGQELTDWQQDLQKAVELQPQHISTYSLTVEVHTPIYDLIKNKTVVPCSEDQELLMYEHTMDFLAANGFEHYEISNFGLPGYYSQHNLGYWQDKEYLGVGIGASSYINGSRWKNAVTFSDYEQLLNSGIYPVAEQEKIVGKEKLAESIILGLRLIKGVVINDQVRSLFNESIEKLKLEQLIDEKNDRIFLTRKGVCLANCVFREIVQ